MKRQVEVIRDAEVAALDLLRALKEIDEMPLQTIAAVKRIIADLSMRSYDAILAEKTDTNIGGL